MLYSGHLPIPFQEIRLTYEPNMSKEERQKLDLALRCDFPHPLVFRVDTIVTKTCRALSRVPGIASVQVLTVVPTMRYRYGEKEEDNRSRPIRRNGG